MFVRYHHGHKHSAAGKPLFVPPAAGPWQSLPACFEWNDYIITAVSEAPDLIEGAQIAGVSIRSMHDVQVHRVGPHPASKTRVPHNTSRVRIA